MLQAARQRFLAHGYAATTIAEIARDAGVSVETVLLVLERGWSASRYGEFITEALTDALLKR